MRFMYSNQTSEVRHLGEMYDRAVCRSSDFALPDSQMLADQGDVLRASVKSSLLYSCVIDVLGLDPCNAKSV